MFTYITPENHLPAIKHCFMHYLGKYAWWSASGINKSTYLTTRASSYNRVHSWVMINYGEILVRSKPGPSKNFTSHLQRDHVMSRNVCLAFNQAQRCLHCVAYGFFQQRGWGVREVNYVDVCVQCADVCGCRGLWGWSLIPVGLGCIPTEIVLYIITRQEMGIRKLMLALMSVHVQFSDCHL